MSRKVTSFLYHATNMATSPMAERNRAKTKSGLISKIQKDLAGLVKTPKGSLKILSFRGKNMAAAVSGFESDEPEMLHWIDNMMPGDVFWDIGANIGMFTMYAAMRKDLEILAFEPNGLNFGILTEHLILNKLDGHAKCFCVAFAQKTEIGELVCGDAEVGQAGNNLADADNKSLTEEKNGSFRQSVPVFSIDDFRQIFGLKNPTHIKLDVDGLEQIIIRGGENTLKQAQSLMLEVEGDAARQTELVDLALATGMTEKDITHLGGKGRNRLFTRS